MIVPQAQKLTVHIEKLSLGGEGIARIPSNNSGSPSNLVAFVPYSAPDEKIEIKITEKKKNFVRGAITQIVQKAQGRIVPACPYFFSPSSHQWCGGCNFQHLKYETQLQEKTKIFKETLSKIASIPENYIFPIVGNPTENEWRYRNKIQIPLGRDNNHKVMSGFFAPHSHHIVPIQDCLIHSEKMMEIVRFVQQQMNQHKLAPYSEKTHTGWLRHLIVRKTEWDNKMLIIFVTLNPSLPYQSQWVKLMKKKFPNVVGFHQNINHRQTNVILGTKWKKIYGQDYLVEKLNGLGPHDHQLKLRISAGSFFQVNTLMAERVYSWVRNLVSNSQSDQRSLLLDLYCGIGGIGLRCASQFKKVIGADESFSSIHDAKQNAQLNGLSNCEFFCGDVELFLKDFLFTPYHLPIDCLLLDPPRAGCSEKVLKQIVKLQPSRIIYVSCEPSTLSRDLKFLMTDIYQVKQIQPFDFFPQSSHIESVSLIEKILKK